MILKIDEDTCVTEIYNVRDNNQKYKEAQKKFREAIKTGDGLDIEDSVALMEMIAADIIYKKAFHDGMKFILNTMAGKEVIAL